MSRIISSDAFLNALILAPILLAIIAIPLEAWMERRRER